MLLDNSTEEQKVITEFQTNSGNNKIFKAVTGYFTVGALHDVFEAMKSSEEFTIIFGDLLQEDSKDVPIDLINGNISLQDAFDIPEKAKKVIEVLKTDKVKIKVLEPNFCHAKVYLAVSDNKRNSYYVTGSSNLTEAGLGIKTYHNIELNIIGTGIDPQFDELEKWYDNLWSDKQARDKITLEDGSKKDVKQYLIDLIGDFTIKYDPIEIYYKVLFELFRNQINDERDPQLLKDLGKLENSKVYSTLYEFQQKGVLSMIKMLNKYNGAILADAVGLGKTWSALAVIKYFQNKGYKTVLLVPKKLEQNWRAYKLHQGSLFEEDRFDYVIRFHTDLQDERIDNKSDGLKLKNFFQSNDKKLFVIDESHNLRNSKSGRYNYLVEHLLNEEVNPNHKVLMLSATPINTSFTDIRNQFKLMVNNSIDGFHEHFGIRNVDALFNRVQKQFNKWRGEDTGTINDLVQMLPDEFATLADHLIVARTRKVIKGMAEGFNFPSIEKPISNFYITPSEIGTLESFEDLFVKFPDRLAAYSPYLYIEDDRNKSVLENEAQRDFFLVKMMYILMVKRLESSWYGFFSTIKKIREKTNLVFELIKEYERGESGLSLLSVVDEDFDEEENEDFTFNGDSEKFSIGKRRLKIKNIDDSGNLQLMKEHLKDDLNQMDLIIANLEKFDSQIAKENKSTSKDTKLEKLISYITEKQDSGKNKKVLVFTAYRDTAFYLYSELNKRGISKTAMVSGSEAYYYKSEELFKKYNGILERFCPYTKLFKEKVWREFESTLNPDEKKTIDNYNKWLDWIKDNDSDTQHILEEEVDILIATDCLSEGQNLQDCDCVVNYDIHWNPVRIIQRVGRVDRLGSPNSTFKVANFWPTDNIDKYLNLEGRIVDRLVAARMAGTEVESDMMKRLKNKMQDDDTDTRQLEKLTKQLEQNIDELDGDESFGFDNLSLDPFRQDLIGTLNDDGNRWSKIPKGSFSGFVAVNTDFCPQQGVIALMGYPAKKRYAENHAFKSFKLVFVNEDGKSLHVNQMKTLNALNIHKKETRSVPQSIDNREVDAIEKYRNMLLTYFEKNADDSTIEAKDSKKNELANILSGNKTTLDNVFEHKDGLDALADPKNYELLAWMIVSKS